MIVVIINSSKKKAFRSSKRIISEVVQPITNRVNLGDIPKRVLIQLVKNLKLNATRGTSVQIFFESKNIGYRGFKCVEVGTKKASVYNFTMSKSLIDKDLFLSKIIGSLDP